MLASLIASQIESDEPDKILEALRPHNGKMITERLLTWIPNGKERYRIVKHYGWTSLEYRNNLASYFSLMLCRTEASVPLDCDWIEKENTAYFEGRRNRTTTRLRALGNIAALQAFNNQVESFVEAMCVTQAALKGVLDTIEKDFEVDSSTIQEALGLCPKNEKFTSNAFARYICNWKVLE
jgi:hypothetical protein